MFVDRPETPKNVTLWRIVYTSLYIITITIIVHVLQLPFQFNAIAPWCIIILPIGFLLRLFGLVIYSIIYGPIQATEKLPYVSSKAYQKKPHYL